MGCCTDFQEEETALQHLGKQLGSKVIFTPKFHCKFAGEGIEDNWAHAKAKMRATPLCEKKGCAKLFSSSRNVFVLKWCKQKIELVKCLQQGHEHTYAHATIFCTERRKMQVLLMKVFLPVLLHFTYPRNSRD